MYSFHPFGGLSSHPYGGSVGGPIDLGASFNINAQDLGKKAVAAGKRKAKKAADRLLGGGGRGSVPKPPPAKNAAKKAMGAYSSAMSLLNTMKAETGASVIAAKAQKADMAAISRARNTLSQVDTGVLRMTPGLVQAAQMMEEQGLMGAGGEAEEGFLSKYKNFVIIGGAVVVVGVAAFFMLRK